ncbi:MAG: hypothetical protein ACRC80_15180, partial [Waterburya sp.]
MIDTYELFYKIKEKPPLYIGGRSIYQLKAFYDGYIFAKMELGEPITAQDEDFEHFHSWLEQRLNARTNLSWVKILEFCSRDEREALDLFFELLDEFINR